MLLVVAEQRTDVNIHKKSHPYLAYEVGMTFFMAVCARKRK